MPPHWFPKLPDMMDVTAKTSCDGTSYHFVEAEYPQASIHIHIKVDLGIFFVFIG